MLVGEVLWTRPVRVPGILSETSPVPGSAIATSDDQVSDAHRISCGRPAGFLSCTGGDANAVRVGMVGRTRPAAMPAPPASRCRREGFWAWFMGDLLGVAGARSAGHWCGGAHGSPDSLYVGRRDAFDETVPGRRRWNPEEALEALEDEEHHEDLRDDGRAGEQRP